MLNEKTALYVGLLKLLVASCGKETTKESDSSDQGKNVEADNYSGTKFVGVRSGIVKYEITSPQKNMGAKFPAEGVSN